MSYYPIFVIVIPYFTDERNKISKYGKNDNIL